MPNPMTWRDSCPECGYIYHNEIELQGMLQSGAVDCPRCKVHHTTEDWMAEANEKHMAQHHNHAKADLSNEEP